MNNDKFERKFKDRDVLKILLGFAKPYKFQFILGLILLMITVMINLLPAYIQGEIIGILDNPALNNHNKLVQVLILIAIFVSLAIAGVLISYIGNMLIQNVGQKILVKIRHDVFTKIESLSISKINETPVGRLVTRVTSDTQALNDFFTNILITFITSGLTIVLVFIFMFVISWKLTLILLSVMPVLIILTILSKHYSRVVSRRVRTDVSNVNSFLSENLSGMKVTQIFNQEEAKLDEFKKKNEALKKSSIVQILVGAFFQPLIYVLFIVCQIIVIYFGIGGIREGVLVQKDFVKFYYYINSFFSPVQQLADLFSQAQQSFAATEKIMSTLENESEPSDVCIDLDHFAGKIEFRNVWFAYEGENWILKDVSFVVNPKETVAFVGATGAGKTTILGLIVRNYEIQKGQILIDDIDITTIKLTCLRRLIGQMLQDVFMFSGTIESNITLNNPKFSREDVIDAVKYVNADKFIAKLPDNYDHEVLERGGNFSAGQRQLISFARTIINKPNIMILDEATSNIDTETELLIQNSLEKMMNVGTMLIVAHRLSTIQHADKIIVLKHGEIIEEGNHQSLLKKKGMYYNLYRIQYKNMEDTNEA